METDLKKCRDVIYVRFLRADLKIKRSKFSKFVNSSILKFFTAIKKMKFKVCILNADWPVVNTRLIFIGCRQECDYSSEKVRLMLKSHSCKPMKL